MNSAFKLTSILIIFFMPPPLAEGEEAFLFKHWKRPAQVKLQNNQIKIYPQECTKCHPTQYSRWQDSFHSKSVRPGLLGQIGNDIESILKNSNFVLSCYFCHAPALEQTEVIQKSMVYRNNVQGNIQEDKNSIVKNPYFDRNFKLSGVSCAVCHLRGGIVYGPPIRDKNIELNVEAFKNYHNRIVTDDSFEQSEFCAACHQLNSGYELNGKVLVNTYREWERSIYGENNITCQNCHMPNGQHLFKGIHDPAMVREGIEILTEKLGDKIRIEIKNSGGGHYFPTYVTPQIIVRGYLIDENKKMIPESLKEAFIGREVNLELTEEFFDTRIAPLESFVFEYKPEYGCKPENCVLEVVVYPDRFYNKFYAAMLKTENDSIKRAYLKRAFEESERSGYLLWREVVN